MKKYVSFIGSLLFNKMLPDDPTEEQKSYVEDQTNTYCSLAKELGHKLTKQGHLVKVGSFSELDISFAKGAVSGAKENNLNPKEIVYQLIGDFTEEDFLHHEAAQFQIPVDDNFIMGRSAFISHAKSIVLLGGHHYAKMIVAWAYNMGIPIFALPHGSLAGMDIWKYLIADGHMHNHTEEIFPGISREEYEEIGILNAEPSWLSEKLYNLIEKSSKNWVKPSILPDDMRYKPKTNQIAINTAFVAMSFNDKKNSVYESIMKACELSGFIGVRGDNKSFYHKDLNIMSNITESIVRSQIMIVDISDRNPNVFYEMGVADTLGKQMVLLFDGKGDVPFDIHGLRHLKYDENKPERIVEPLKEILTGFKLK